MQKRILTSDERLDWLRLSRTESIGPVTFHALLQRYGSATRALAALPEITRKAGRLITPRSPSVADVKQELAKIEALGAQILCACEPAFPVELAAIDDCPPFITVRGHLSVMQKPRIAVVGARNASLNGRRFAESIAMGLADLGWCVTSGLARGIDAAAHHGALMSRSGKGGTIAVVAGGVDVVYPPEHQELYDNICLTGAVIAEMALGAQPQAQHFPRRNRIISGISQGVVVIEAAERSGSLITARMALEQGREVMAVPGSPMDARAAGCNRLIRQGATLVQSVDDVLDALAQPLANLGESEPFDYVPALFIEPDAAELREASKIVREMLGPTPIAVDEILRACQGSPWQFSSASVLSALLELEFSGQLERSPGNRVSLLYKTSRT